MAAGALPIDVPSLHKDELIYELNFRGVTVDDTKTVDQLRTLLRPLVRLENANTSLFYPDYSVDVTVELEALRIKAVDTEMLVSSHSTSNLRLLDSLRARIHHSINRLSRLASVELTAEQVEQRSSLLATLLERLDQIDELRVKVNQPADPSVFPDPIPLLNSTLLQSSTSRCQPVQKWQLKFTGDSRVSVHNFLERVDELRVARGVSESQLFESAIDLFEGKALLWFRSCRDRFNNWKTLRDLLVKHFEPPDYKARLFEDIQNRTQDPNESFVEYYSSMSAMFRRYGPLAEDVQLSMLIRNLAPFYTMQLPTVHDLAQLEDECLKLEQRKYRADHYKPPSRRRSNYVEPDLACVSIPEPMPSRSRTSVPVSVAAVQPATGRCFNCDQLGHAFRNCSAPRRTFCFRCGAVGRTVRNCSNCSGNPAGSR